MQQRQPIIFGLVLAAVLVAGLLWRHYTRDTTIRDITSEEVSTWVQAAEDPDPDIRSAAILNLSAWGRKNPDAVPVLVKALSDSHSSVRSAAAEALGKSDFVASEEVTPQAEMALVRLLSDADRDTRRNASLALGRLRAAESASVQRLMVVLRQDEDEDVRAAAAEALGQIGPPARSAIQALLLARQDRDYRVRKQVDEALERLDPQGSQRSPNSPNSPNSQGSQH